MFFCDPCGKERKWPDSIFQSYGPCEVCGKVGPCNDVPSKYLPLPPKPKPTPIVLVKPECKFGYSAKQLAEMLTEKQLANFLKWMVGQTFSSCSGWVYDHKRGFNVTSGCGPHGYVYYEHDVRRWAEGKPVID